MENVKRIRSAGPGKVMCCKQGGQWIIDRESSERRKEEIEHLADEVEGLRKWKRGEWPSFPYIFLFPLLINFIRQGHIEINGPASTMGRISSSSMDTSLFS